MEEANGLFTESNYTLAERFLWNIYVHDIDKVNIKDENNIPDFMKEMVPIFLIMLVCENIGLYLKGKPLIRVNDGIASIATGMMMTCFKILPFGIEFYGYKFLYEHRFLNPDFNSMWTWWATALLVDLCYYWVHRMSHEIHFLWALGHQVHHSSEDYNLTTSIRQPAFLKFLNHGLYHPLALLGVPLHAVLVHVQFNLIYQYWIHTELIDNIGPLEHIMNTASHHRVHHGMNNWCLDRNYGSILIIWDKIFGTFQAEKRDEKIYYGLIDQPQTFELMHLQTFYAKYTVKKAMAMDSLTKFFKGILFGPAWYPGGPRLGDEPDMTAKVIGRKKFDPVLPWDTTIYIWIQMGLTILIHQKYVDDFATYSPISIVIFSCFIFWSLSIITSLLDGVVWVGRMEVIRCLLAAAFLNRYIIFNYGYVDIAITACLGLSAVFWLYKSSSEPKRKMK